jgi:hypothetical protein
MTRDPGYSAPPSFTLKLRRRGGELPAAVLASASPSDTRARSLAEQGCDTPGAPPARCSLPRQNRPRRSNDRGGRVTEGVRAGAASAYHDRCAMAAVGRQGRAPARSAGLQAGRIDRCLDLAGAHQGTGTPATRGRAWQSPRRPARRRRRGPATSSVGWRSSAWESPATPRARRASTRERATPVRRQDAPASASCIARDTAFPSTPPRRRTCSKERAAGASPRDAPGSASFSSRAAPTATWRRPRGASTGRGSDRRPLAFYEIGRGVPDAGRAPAHGARARRRRQAASQA